MTTLTVDRGVAVPMPDGVRLVADVYRPAGPGRHPVVLLRTPYDRTHAAALGLQVNALDLAAAGYAVVIQDVRGRFASEGRFRPFVDEGADGEHTLAWCAERPWSTGRVAMGGMSYCGYVQVQAARRRPEALRAWAPAFCPLDAGSGWTHDGGAVRLAFGLSLLLGAIGSLDPSVSDPGPLRRAMAAWPETVGRAANAQVELLATPFGDTWRAWSGPPGVAADPDPISGIGAGEHDAPALVVGGWWDIFQHGTFALYRELATGPQAPRLVVGPWDHAPLPLRTGSGDLDFGPAAAVDLPGLQRAWFDHVLQDADAPFCAPVRVFVTGLDAWRDLPAWPVVPEHPRTAWALTADGRLDPVMPQAQVGIAFTVDAADPTPTVGGRLFARPTTLRAGPLDQSARQRRSDVLTFDGPSAARGMVLAGPVSARIHAASSSSVADIVVTLCDVGLDGRAMNIADGVRRLVGLGEDGARFDVEMGHVAHVVRPGHRLRLDVAGMSFPAIDRQPPAGTARRTVFVGGDAGSSVFLPVAEPDGSW